MEHLPPETHPKFYASSRFALNVTRADMIAAGFSPSVRLFEAAACAAPIISDRWQGIETVLDPGSEILLADTTEEVVELLQADDLSDIGKAARRRILGSHTSAHRAAELERHLIEAARASSEERLIEAAE
jgi:spore maturation protein CgeB